MAAGIGVYQRANNLPSQNMGGNLTTLQTVTDQKGNTLSIPFPTNGTFDTVPMLVLVAGRYIWPSATRTLTLNLNIGSTNVGTTGGVTFTQNSSPLFWYEFRLMIAGSTKNLAGWKMGCQSTTGLNPSNTAVGLISIDPNQDANLQSSAQLSFNLTITLGNTQSGDTFFVEAFDLRTY